MKLMNHELDTAIAKIQADQLRPAFKCLARISRIQQQLIQAWDVLSTMTPADYLSFRPVLGQSSGFQSWQYRLLEFKLGLKNEAMMRPHAHRSGNHGGLERASRSPSVYDEALRLLARRGLPFPDDVLAADVRQRHVADARVEAVWATIYRNSEQYFDLYELAEELVDLEDAFQTLALPAHEDGRAHHRHAARHRWERGRVVSEKRARPHALSRIVVGQDCALGRSACRKPDLQLSCGSHACAIKPMTRCATCCAAALSPQMAPSKATCRAAQCVANARARGFVSALPRRVSRGYRARLPRAGAQRQRRGRDHRVAPHDRAGRGGPGYHPRRSGRDPGHQTRGGERREGAPSRRCGRIHCGQCRLPHAPAGELRQSPGQSSPRRAG